MDTPRKGRRWIVRMFPDYADTVLWFGDPVDYDLTGLTQGLVSDLQAWERSYYASLTPDFDWKSPDAAHRFTEEGNRLAQRVADELGDGYEIEFSSYERDVPARRFRGTGAPNARAAAAFDVLAVAVRAGQVEVSRARAAARRGDPPGWFAYAPLSDTVFKPPRAGQE